MLKTVVLLNIFGGRKCDTFISRFFDEKKIVIFCSIISVFTVPFDQSIHPYWIKELIYFKNKILLTDTVTGHDMGIRVLSSSRFQKVAWTRHTAIFMPMANKLYNQCPGLLNWALFPIYLSRRLRWLTLKSRRFGKAWGLGSGAAASD